MFKSTSSTIWLGRETEKRALEMCKEHLVAIKETVAQARTSVHKFCDGKTAEVAKNFQLVFESERKADELKKQIFDELSKGIFHPIDREEIIRFILTTEDVADQAKAASRKLGFIPPKKLDKELKNALRTLADKVFHITEMLDNTFSTFLKNPSESIKSTHTVEQIEEEIDDFRADILIPKILAWCDKSKSISLSMMLKEIADNMENAADACEDAADVIRGIAIAYG